MLYACVLWGAGIKHKMQIDRKLGDTTLTLQIYNAYAEKTAAFIGSYIDEYGRFQGTVRVLE